MDLEGMKGEGALLNQNEELPIIEPPNHFWVFQPFFRLAPWAVDFVNPLCCQYSVLFFQASCVLQFTYTATYPDEPMVSEIKDYENIDEEHVGTLQELIKEQVSEPVWKLFLSLDSVPCLPKSGIG